MLRLLLACAALVLAGCWPPTRLTANGARTDPTYPPRVSGSLEQVEHKTVWACQQLFDGEVSLDGQARTVVAKTRDASAEATITLAPANHIGSWTEVDVVYASSQPNPEGLVKDLVNTIVRAPSE